jgi:hypothetical protein
LPLLRELGLFGNQNLVVCLEIIVKCVGKGLISYHLLGMNIMARIDSLIMVMLGLAQLLIGDAIGLELLGILLQGTGGGTIVMGIYFLIFLSRHQKEFSDSYSKLEKTRLARDGNGDLHYVDAQPTVTKVVWYIIPAVLTLIGAITWLADV